MKRYWLRISSFILIFILFFSFLNQVMAVPWPSLKDLNKLEKNSVDVIFLGNSHNYASFQPKVVNDLLPVKAYTIGTPAESVVISYYELIQVLKYQHPKIIVFETYTADGQVNISKGFIFRFLDSIGWNKSKLAVIFRYLYPDRLSAVFPILRTRIQWDHPEKIFTKVKNYIKGFNSQEVNPDLGASLFTNVIAEDTYHNQSKYIDLREREAVQENKTYLEKIVALCREQKIQLIFTTAPVLQKDRQNYDYYDPLNLMDYAKKEQIPVIYLDQRELSMLHYSDPGHVNGLGSLMLSIQLADELAKYLNLSVDENKKSVYREFDFSGYEIERENGNYTIRLKESRENSPILYKWQLMNSDEQVKKETGWQKKENSLFRNRKAITI